MARTVVVFARSPRTGLVSIRWQSAPLMNADLNIEEIVAAPESAVTMRLLGTVTLALLKYRVGGWYDLGRAQVALLALVLRVCPPP